MPSLNQFEPNLYSIRSPIHKGAGVLVRATEHSNAEWNLV